MSDTSTLQPPAQAAANPPADGAQPPLGHAGETAQTTQATQANAAFAREENARTVLRGDAAAPESAEQTRQAGLERQREIDAQFDPETGELLDEDPLTITESENPKPESETPPAPAENAVESSNEENQEAAAETDPKSEDGADDEAEKGRGKRIRIRRDSLSDRDFAILTLAREKRLSFADAERQLFGGSENEPAGEAEQASRLLPASAAERRSLHRRRPLPPKSASKSRRCGRSAMPPRKPTTAGLSTGSTIGSPTCGMRSTKRARPRACSARKRSRRRGCGMPRWKPRQFIARRSCSRMRRWQAPNSMK